MSLCSLYKSADCGEKLSFWSTLIGVVITALITVIGIFLAYLIGRSTIKSSEQLAFALKHTELNILLASALNDCKDSLRIALSKNENIWSEGAKTAVVSSLRSCEGKINVGMAGYSALSQDMGMEDSLQITTEHLKSLDRQMRQTGRDISDLNFSDLENRKTFLELSYQMIQSSDPTRVSIDSLEQELKHGAK